MQDDPTQQVLLGLKADLSDLTELGQPMYLGVMIGSEKFGDELLAFLEAALASQSDVRRSAASDAAAG